jgi:hypothetical protein
MRSDKYYRALAEYNGHKGSATLAHVERNLLSAYPTAREDLTGVQYGRVMSVANTSYHDGKAAATNNGDVWDYASPIDWIAGIGPKELDGNGGYRNAARVEVAADHVLINTIDGKTIIYDRRN